MTFFRSLLVVAALGGALFSTACQSTESRGSAGSTVTSADPAQPDANESTTAAPDPGVEVPLDFAKPGFFAVVEDGRLWVFREDSPELEAYRAHGEPAKQVVRPGAGPNGMTIKGPDGDTIDAYLVTRPGFDTRIVDRRLWVFREGSPDIAEFERVGEPAKFVVRPLAGPLGMTMRAPDVATIEEYLATKPGFVARYDDGRLWIFRAASEGLAEYDRVGEPAKSVIRPGAGPRGMTVKAVDTETLDAYLNAPSV